MISSENELQRRIKSRRNRFLMLLAGLVFMVSQTIDLQHTHENDLNLKADCSICLKISSLSDGVFADAVIPPVSNPAALIAAVAFQSQPGTLITPKSRAPPAS